jgi:membrane fusion protein (multidrug efflux system)
MNTDLKKYILLLFAVFLVFGCQQREAKDTALEAIPVKVIRAIPQDVQRTLDYVGNIKAREEVQVYPKVTGKIIEKVREEGSLIAKGEPIAYIDRDEVGLKFERAPVESPIQGIIGKVYVDIGSSVTPQSPVAFVVNMDKVKIYLDIPEKYLPSVSMGQEARISVDAYPGEVFTGGVVKISPIVDIYTRSAPIEIEIDNEDHRLKSGMFCRVSLAIEEHKGVIVIPKESIMGFEPDTYVYLAKDNKAVLRKITTGIRQDSHLEVIEGMQEGDLLVIMGQQRLYEGASLRVEE